MRKSIIIFVGLCATLFVPAWSSGGRESIRIAALYNVTGGMASIDRVALDGVKLAAKLINRRGGLLGGRMIEVLDFNTETDLALAREAARSMVSLGVAAGIGYGDSTYVLAAAPAFQGAGIPFVTSGATLPDLPKTIGDRLFMVAFGDDAQAHAIAAFTNGTLKARKVLIWTDSSMEFTMALSAYFKRYFVEAGGTIVREDLFPTGEKDFSTLIGALKALRPLPDAIFISAVPDEAALTVRQIRESGMTLPIVSGDGFDSELVVTVPGKKLADRVYFATHMFKEETGKEATEFIRAYKKEYGREPPSAFAALGYDTMNLVAEAIRRAGTTDREDLTRALASTQGFKAVTGDISYVAPKSAPHKPVSIIGIEKGEYKKMGTWKP